MDRADEERLIHAAGSQLWAKASTQNCFIYKRARAQPPTFKKKKQQQRKFVIISSAILFNLPKAPDKSDAIFPLFQSLSCLTHPSRLEARTSLLLACFSVNNVPSLQKVIFLEQKLYENLQLTSEMGT